MRISLENSRITVRATLLLMPLIVLMSGIANAQSVLPRPETPFRGKVG